MESSQVDKFSLANTLGRVPATTFGQRNKKYPRRHSWRDEQSGKIHPQINGSFIKQRKFNYSI